MQTFCKHWFHVKLKWWYTSWFSRHCLHVLIPKYLTYFSVVSQAYSTDAHKIHVIIGNSALVKCDIPSFVSDFVSVVSWIDNDSVEYFPSQNGSTMFKILGFYLVHTSKTAIRIEFFFKQTCVYLNASA